MKSSAPTTDHAKRIAIIFHRRLETKWQPKEIKAFRALVPINENDLCRLERYYRKNWPPGKNGNYLRRQLLTFLNHFQGEVDEANRWNEAHPEKKPPRIMIPFTPKSEPYIEPIRTPEQQAQHERFLAELNRRKQARKA